MVKHPARFQILFLFDFHFIRFRLINFFLALVMISAMAGSCAKAPLKSEKQKHTISSLISKARHSASSDRTIAYLEKAIRLDTLTADAYLALAEHYESLNHEWKAESVLLSGYSAGIREPALLYHLGRIALELNKFSEASSYLKQIPRNDSLYLPAVFLEARSNILKNDFFTAVKWLDTLSRYDSWKNKPELLSMRRGLKEKGFFSAFNTSTPVERIVDAETVTRYDLAILAGFYLGISADSQPTLIFADIAVAEAIYPVCAAAVQYNFLEALPDGKFHPRRGVKKRNLAFYLFNWLKFRRFDFGSPVRPVTTWKDITSSDPHFTLMATMEKFGADLPVSGKDADAAFQRTMQLIKSGQ